jgi:hypothetical protein
MNNSLCHRTTRVALKDDSGISKDALKPRVYLCRGEVASSSKPTEHVMAESVPETLYTLTTVYPA